MRKFITGVSLTVLLGFVALASAEEVVAPQLPSRIDGPVLDYYGAFSLCWADCRTLVFSRPYGKQLRPYSVAWEFAKSREVARFEDSGGPVSSPADGKRIAILRMDRTNRENPVPCLIVHDLEKQIDAYVLKGEIQMQFARGGRIAATIADDNKTLRLRDADSGKELEKLPAHRSRVVWFDFSPDGKLLASLVESGLVRVWDVEAKKLRYYLPRQRTPIKAAAWSPDGKTLATMTAQTVPSEERENELALWDAEKGEARHGIDFFNKKSTIDNVDQLTYSPDGNTILILDRGLFMSVDLKTEEVRYHWRRGWGLTRSFALSPDGKLIAYIQEKDGKAFITVEDYEEFRKLALPRKEYVELHEKLRKEREKK